MLRRASFLVLLGCLAACQFDASGVAAFHNDASLGGTDGADATPGQPADAGACDQNVAAKIAVDDATEPLGAGQAYAQVLLGDTVVLSGEASCGKAPLRYAWTITPADDTADTALPNLSSTRVSVYPTNVAAYTVSLTVTDAEARESTQTINGFEAFGWQRLDGLPDGQDTRDLAVGNDSLWLATEAGAYRASLLTPTSGFVEVNTEATGLTIDDKLGATYYAPESKLVWFGQRDARRGVWRVDLNQVPADIDELRFDGLFELGESAKVRAIGFADPGVEIATEVGMTWAMDNTSFSGSFPLIFDVDLRARARGNDQAWAGGRSLYDMDQNGLELSPFGFSINTDAKIRSLLVDEAVNELWVASKDFGIARLNNADGTLITHYDSTNSDLPDEEYRDVAIETGGSSQSDLWVASKDGMVRFKRDRGVWVTMGASHGLTDRTDLNCVVVDQGADRRTIYAGSRDGLVYMRVQ